MLSNITLLCYIISFVYDQTQIQVRAGLPTDFAELLKKAYVSVHPPMSSYQQKH